MCPMYHLFLSSPRVLFSYGCVNPCALTPCVVQGEARTAATVKSVVADFEKNVVEMRSRLKQQALEAVEKAKTDGAARCGPLPLTAFTQHIVQCPQLARHVCPLARFSVLEGCAVL